MMDFLAYLEACTDEELETVQKTVNDLLWDRRNAIKTFPHQENYQTQKITLAPISSSKKTPKERRIEWEKRLSGKCTKCGKKITSVGKISMCRTCYDIFIKNPKRKKRGY